MYIIIPTAIAKNIIQRDLVIKTEYIHIKYALRPSGVKPEINNREVAKKCIKTKQINKDGNTKIYVQIPPPQKKVRKGETGMKNRGNNRKKIKCLTKFKHTNNCIKMYMIQTNQFSKTQIVRMDKK